MNALKIALFAIIGALLFWALIENAPAFSAFGAAFLIAAISIAILWAVDFYLLKTFNTLEELKNGNIAVALALMAYAIITGFAILAAFAVWR